MRQPHLHMIGPVLMALALGACGGSGSSTGQGMPVAEPVDINEHFFFSANDGASGTSQRQLWRTDGTSDGTIRVSSAFTGGPPGPHNFIRLDDRLLFEAYDEDYYHALWTSDGSTDGTRALRAEGRSGPDSPASLTRVGDMAFFSAADDTSFYQLWMTDGSPENTRPVPGFPAGFVLHHDVASRQASLANFNDQLYFSVSEIGPLNYGIWRTDGTEAGTQEVFSGAERPFIGLHAANTQLFFFQQIGNEIALWRTDGTEAGTRKLRQWLAVMPPNQASQAAVVMDDMLYFTSHDGAENGFQLWQSDGTEDGTVRLSDAPDQGVLSPFNQIVVADGRVIFAPSSAGITLEGTALWISDGSAEGTQELLPADPGSPHRIRDLTQVGPLVYFMARHNGHHTLWRSDGTTDGTHPVAPENGNLWSLDHGMRALGDQVFFPLQQSGFGIEVWRSDGTEAGTIMLRDICPGTCSAVDYESF